MGLCCCGARCKFCCRKYTSIKSQYCKTTLLIGLKQNPKLQELNAILQCLCHIETLVNYVKYKYEHINQIKSYVLRKKKGKSLFFM